MQCTRSWLKVGKLVLTSGNLIENQTETHLPARLLTMESKFLKNSYFVNSLIDGSLKHRFNSVGRHFFKLKVKLMRSKQRFKTPGKLPYIPMKRISGCETKKERERN